MTVGFCAHTYINDPNPILPVKDRPLILEPIITAAITFALSQITLSALLFSRSNQKLSLQEWLFLAFLFTVAAYLLQPIIKDHWLSHIRDIIEDFIPGLFWLLCSSLFNDRFKIKAWSICLIAPTVTLPLLGQILNGFNITTSPIIFYYFPQIIEFILLGWALVEVVRHWGDDLIEHRRDLRLWFCTMTSLYNFGLVVLREIVLPDSELFAYWQYLPVGLICLFTNLLLIQYRPGLLSVVDNTKPHVINQTIEPKIEPKTLEVEVPDKVIAGLDELMEKQFFYRKMGLTIGQLAEELDLPEYRLRRIINAGLGFRNFNDYLNGFRIKDAGKRLSDPSQNNEAVLNIALDTGFRSLSSFNKAFKEAYGVTPTTYRQQQNKS